MLSNTLPNAWLPLSLVYDAYKLNQRVYLGDDKNWQDLVEAKIYPSNMHQIEVVHMI